MRFVLTPRYFFVGHDLAGREHEDAGAAGFRQQCGIARIERLDARERIQVRAIADIQPVLIDGGCQLHGLEELCRGTGEHREPVRGRLDLCLEELLDPLAVAIERLAFRRAGLEGAGP